MIKERDALKQRINERKLIDELSSVKKENEILREKFEVNLETLIYMNRMSRSR